MKNPLLVAFGLLMAGAVVFMALWALFETDPQYRNSPSYVEAVK